jgi:hypothetical protein
MKKLLLSFVIVLLTFSASYAISDCSTPLSSPTDGDQANQIDDFMRANAGYYQERFVDQNQTPDTSWVYGWSIGETNDTVGLKWTPFIVMGDSPVAIGNRPYIFCIKSNNVAELFFMNGNGNVVQLTAGGSLNDSALTASLGDYLKKNGTTELTNHWDAGNYNITAQHFASEIATGVGAPFNVASTDKVAQLNVEMINSKTDTEIKMMGVPDTTSYSQNVTYQASTDGFVTSYITSAASTYGYVGPTPSNLEIIAHTAGTGPSASILTITFPVKKDYYWKVNQSHKITWTPIGD